MTEQTDAAEVIPCYVVIGEERVTDLTEWLVAHDAQIAAAAEARGAERALREAAERVRGPSEFLRDEGTCHSIALDLEAAAAREAAAVAVRAPGGGA